MSLLMLIPNGRMIRALRKEKGLTQIELADLSGVNSRVIGQLERAKNIQQAAVVNPTLRTLNRLAQALGVMPIQLVNDVPTPPEPEEDRPPMDAAA